MLTFSQKLIFATGLLFLDKRVSYRRLCRELELDEEGLSELRYELVVVKQIAREENGELLVWAADDCGTGAEAAPAEDQKDEPTLRRDRVPRAADYKHGESHEAERRQLTVMFCDLEGSTELATRTDPEDLREIITRFQDKCREAIARYDGFVARYMGDGILVYFGYPQAHEDDSARAVRAGLDVARSMPVLNLELAGNYNVGLSVRVGVATGPVVVGDLIGEGAAEEAAAVGKTPNLAARLQGVARSNQVVVDDVVHRLIRDRFEFEDLGTHSLKGIARPVQAWRAVSEKDPDAPTTARRTQIKVPLVGRQEELGLLLRSWEASKTGHGQVVSIQGDAGIGKSRLFEALRERIAGEDYLSVVVRCSPYHMHSSLYPVIVHLGKVMDWAPDDSTDVRLSKLESALAQRGSVLSETVPLFAELLSLPFPDGRYEPLNISPKQQRERILDTLSGWLFEEAEKKPVLQVWEDLHWADPTTLELLGLYIEQSPTVPMLNIVTYRPEFVPSWPSRSHITPITLNRLERPEIEALIRYQAGGKSTPLEVVEHVVDKSDGVPLYVEELTKTILESEYLHEEAGQYVLTGALSEVSVPATLQDSLMARLDRVPMAREVAQLGAVLGREFAYEMLLSLSSLEEAILRQGLDQLVGNELLYQRGRLPRARFIFKHALIHDAAYQSLLRRTRQQYHRDVARLLKERFQETVTANPELLAHHYTEAGDLEEAVQYWLKAGQKARDKSANLEALGHFEKGLDVLSGMPDSQQKARLELALQIALGGVTIVTRGHAAKEVETAYNRARALGAQLDDAPEVFSSVFGLWRFFIVCRHNSDVLDIAHQLIRLSDEDDDPVRYVIAHYALGFTEVVVGRLAAGLDNLEKAVARYEPAQRKADIYRAAHDPCTACLAYMSNCEWLLGYPDRALRRAQESLALAEQIQDPVSLAHALCFCTITSEMVGDDARTGEMAARTVAVSLDKGFAAWIAVGKLTSTWIAIKTGRGDATIEQLHDEIEAFSNLGYDILRSYFLTLFARACDAAGQPEKGLMALDQALQIVDARGEYWWHPEIVRLRGELLSSVRPGDEPAVEELYLEALELARTQASRSLELRAAMSLADLCKRQGNSGKGIELVKSVRDRFDEGFGTSDLKRAAALLGNG